ncbi:MAG TPA: hypothetical protein VNG51_08010 [Ktedonobacteraceae bacterium]|nr:hypothetical protein [Ktedonobacteraceae bacterium]
MKQRYVVELDTVFWLVGNPHAVTDVVEASSPDVAIRKVMRQHRMACVSDAWAHVEGVKPPRFTYRSDVTVVLATLKEVP